MSTVGSLSSQSSISSLQLRRSVERAGRSTLLSDSETPSNADRSFANTLGAATELSGQRISVNLTIDSLSSRALNATVPPRGGPAPLVPQPAPRSSGGGSNALSASLESVDPKLAQGIEALLDFIRQQDPEAAAALEESLTSIFGGQSPESAPGASFSNPTPAPASDTPTTGAEGLSFRAENVRLAVEATFAQLQENTDGGVSISAESVRITFEANFAQITGMRRADPLALDLDDNGNFDTTDVFNGHFFDLLGKGQKVQAATIGGGDGLLALDRNGNGTIDDGNELFGDQHGAEDGYAELGKFDENRDGVIDAQDSVFGKLLVFRDANLNGQSEVNELSSLSDFRIASISLASKAANEETNGNLVSRVGSFTREDGTQGRAGDLLLNYLA